MSKKFKSQDYTAYKKLGTKWRKPKGHQSKLRKKKAGAGPVVSVGYRTPKADRGKQRNMHFILVRSIKDLEKAKEGVLIGSGVGAKKAGEIAANAKEIGLTVLNKKKLKRAEKIKKKIESKKAKKIREEKKKLEEKKEEGQKEKEVAKEEKPQEKKKEDVKEKAGGSKKEDVSKGKPVGAEKKVKKIKKPEEKPVTPKKSADVSIAAEKNEKKEKEEEGDKKHVP